MKFALNSLANVVSFLFHPLLLPTYAIAITLITHQEAFSIGIQHPLTILAMVVFYTLFFPVFSILILKGLGMIENLYLKDRQQRIGPYILTFFFYFLCFYTFRNPELGMPKIIPTVMLAATISVVLGFMINLLKLKVSLHAIGSACLTSIILFLMVITGYDLVNYLAGSIVLAGIIGTSRLILKAHTNKEVYVGYFIGALGTALSLIFYLI